jgi:hypothetical protein
MEIKAKYFKLIENAYHDMENRGIDLSEYEISIYIEGNILYVRFFKQESTTMRGSPLGYPIINYEINITTGEIINIQGER